MNKRLILNLCLQGSLILILCSCVKTVSHYKKNFSDAPLSAICYGSLYGEGNFKIGTSELLSETGKSCKKFVWMGKKALFNIVKKEAISAKNKDSKHKFANKSNKGLCLEWMNYPSVNVHQKARKYEINRRRLDCWDYGNVVEAQRNANQRVTNTIRNMGRSYTNVRSQQRPKGSDLGKCINDGGSLMCDAYPERKIQRFDFKKSPFSKFKSPYE